MELLLTLLLNLLGLYLLIGLLFAAIFLVRGITKVDAATEGSSWWFKLMVLPGTIVFWPVLWRKWRQSKQGVSKEDGNS